MGTKFSLVANFYRGFCLFMLRRWRDAEEKLHYVDTNGNTAGRWNQNTDRSFDIANAAKFLLAILHVVSRGSKKAGVSLTARAYQELTEDMDNEVLSIGLKEALATADEGPSFSQAFKTGAAFLVGMQQTRANECFLRLLTDLHNIQLKPLLDLYTTITLERLRTQTSATKPMDEIELHCALLHQKLQAEMEEICVDDKTGKEYRETTQFFYVDYDKVKVEAVTVQKDYAESFLKQISEMTEISKKIGLMDRAPVPVST